MIFEVHAARCLCHCLSLWPADEPTSQTLRLLSPSYAPPHPLYLLPQVLQNFDTTLFSFSFSLNLLALDASSLSTTQAAPASVSSGQWGCAFFQPPHTLFVPPTCVEIDVPWRESHGPQKGPKSCIGISHRACLALIVVLFL